MKLTTSIGKQEGGTATGRSTEVVLAKRTWLEERVRGGANNSLLMIIITTTDRTHFCAWWGVRPSLNPCENFRRKHVIPSQHTRNGGSEK